MVQPTPRRRHTHLRSISSIFYTAHVAEISPARCTLRLDDGIGWVYRLSTFVKKNPQVITLRGEHRMLAIQPMFPSVIITQLSLLLKLVWCPSSSVSNIALHQTPAALVHLSASLTILVMPPFVEQPLPSSSQRSVERLVGEPWHGISPVLIW